VFDEIRQAFRELLHGNVPPGGRHELLRVMKDTLVRARLSLEDLRASLEVTRRRLQTERVELETVRRRKGLAQGIGDAETVTIADRFEVQLLERLVVFEKKEGAQASELELVEREVEEMTQQFREASAGVGSGLRPGPVQSASESDDGHENLERELDSIGRAQRRAAAEAEAEARLADLKRRMGK